MIDTLPPTSYVSRVIPASPDVVRVAFQSSPAARLTRLRRHWSSSFPVRFELQPWSAGATELGLRFVGRRRPTDRALVRAAWLVEGLATELELRCLLALHPAHSAGAPERDELVSAWL